MSAEERAWLAAGMSISALVAMIAETSFEGGWSYVAGSVAWTVFRVVQAWRSA